MKYFLIAGHVLSLLLGVFIYLSFRAENLRVFRWIRYLLDPGWIGGLRRLAAPYAGAMPPWLVYSLPDGLWVFSYTCLMLAIWEGRATRGSLIWFLVIPALAVASEVLQYFGWIQGRFDWVDLCFYSAGFLLPLVALRVWRSRWGAGSFAR